jgi:hypothetical protein
MASDSINRWASLSANIGVLIGLIFLIVELKQANDLALASAYRSRGEEIQAAMQEIALSAELAEIQVKVNTQGLGALDDVETVRYRAWINAGVFRMQNQYNDYELGFLDDESYQALLDEAVRRYPMWKKLNILLTNQRFIQAVESSFAGEQADEQ